MPKKIGRHSRRPRRAAPPCRRRVSRCRIAAKRVDDNADGDEHGKEHGQAHEDGEESAGRRDVVEFGKVAEFRWAAAFGKK